MKPPIRLIVAAAVATITSLVACHPQQSQPAFTAVEKAPPPGLSSGDWEIIRTLHAHGIPVVAPSSCQPGLEGVYQVRENVLVLCPGSHTGGIGDTLRHEAIHAAQDCSAGLENTTLSVLFREHNPFLKGGSDRLSEVITHHYHEPEHRPLEWEAFRLAADLSSEEVAALVQAYCAP